MIKDPISTTQAALILGRDPSAVRHMIAKGKLVYERRGRDNFVSKKSIEALRIARETRASNGKKK